MSRRVLISEELIVDVMKLLIYLEFDLNYGDSDEIRRLCSEIDAGISEKLEKMKLHKAFTAYKTATPGPERESLRKDYIELAQIRKSFTSDQEIPYNSLS